MLFQFPIEDRYVARNQRVAGPLAELKCSELSQFKSGLRDQPSIRNATIIQRVPDRRRLRVVSGSIWIISSAHGFRGNAFTCEPVHNLVHREVLKSDGIVFTGKRADDEQQSEFLASSDLWFRPVQARTGPDGALYIVDMYRFLIEHPRWIPTERLAKIEVRAGAEMGRIYRVDCAR
jgi:hypothetical protein